jgi:hypothetical protein
VAEVLDQPERRPPGRQRRGPQLGVVETVDDGEHALALGAEDRHQDVVVTHAVT